MNVADTNSIQTAHFAVRLEAEQLTMTSTVQWLAPDDVQ